MSKRYVKFDEYAKLVQQICRDMGNDLWRPDYVVGITRGGLLPATMISHYLEVPMHSLHVSLRDNRDLESNLWMAEEAFGYVPESDREQVHSRWDPSYRKKILIVDDINDTGATFEWIKLDWESGCLPNETSVWNSVWGQNVRFAAVFDNFRSKFSMPVNYAGEEIDKTEDEWIVFPYENWWK